MQDAYYTPATPGDAIHSKLGSLTDEYCAYHIALNKHVVTINQRLRQELLGGPPGSHAYVRVALNGITQRLLLGLVLAYRAAGWGVAYGRDRDADPYIEIGIAPV